MRAPTSRPGALIAVGLALALGLAVPGVLPAQGGWSLDGLEGGKLTEAQVESGSTILVVWAAWSPRCRDIVERVNAIVADHGGARVVMVDFQEDPSEVRAFLGGKRARAAVYLDRDGAFSREHRMTTLPGLVVYKDGAVTYRGKLPDDASQVLADALK